jgi:hypothetical protein
MDQSINQEPNMPDMSKKIKTFFSNTYPHIYTNHIVENVVIPYILNTNDFEIIKLFRRWCINNDNYWYQELFKQVLYHNKCNIFQTLISVYKKSQKNDLTYCSLEAVYSCIFEGDDNVEILREFIAFGIRIRKYNTFKNYLLPMSLLYGRFNCMMFFINVINEDELIECFNDIEFYDDNDSAFRTNNIIIRECDPFTANYILRAAIIGKNINCLNVIISKHVMISDDSFKVLLKCAAQHSTHEILHMLFSLRPAMCNDNELLSELLSYALSSYKIENIKLLYTMGAKYNENINTLATLIRDTIVNEKKDWEAGGSPHGGCMLNYHHYYLIYDTYEWEKEWKDNIINEINCFIILNI